MSAHPKPLAGFFCPCGLYLGAVPPGTICTECQEARVYRRGDPVRAEDACGEIPPETAAEQAGVRGML